MAAGLVRVRAVARGRVQMVGYRAFVLRAGVDAGVRGTVRNAADGSVEAVLEGEKAAVETVLERMRRGPSHARVDSLDVERLDAAGDLPELRVTA